MTHYVAIDGGGTATRAALYDADRRPLAETQGPGCNPVAYGIDACAAILEALARTLLEGVEGPIEIAAAIAGASRPHLRGRLAPLLRERLGARRVLVCDDIRPTLFTNLPGRPGRIAVAGTGSSVIAQDAAGQTRLIGGRGSIFGDDGSAYHIAVLGLRAAARAVDGLGPGTLLTEVLPKAAGQPDMAAMPAWCQGAGKGEIAALARDVIRLAGEGDVAAAQAVDEAAEALAGQVCAPAAAATCGPDAPVLLHGGLFEHQPLYRATFEIAMQSLAPGAPLIEPERKGPRAALELALAREFPEGFPVSISEGAAVAESLAPTETRLADAPYLDRLDARGIVHLMSREDAKVAQAVARQADAIARVIDLVADAFRRDGRLIYAGAGTSGRLGVLDASECPPTFGVEPGRVIGIIAGGDRALRHSVEGAEDNRAQAAADLDALEPALSDRDVVVGIAASGTTPYVHAALEYARQHGAAPVLLCCNPRVRPAGATVIAVDTGPEVLTGSTRLKAGTATKLVLNMITTGAMARSGWMYDGLMVRVRPVNAKLRKRAARIVAALTGRDGPAAAELLHAAGDAIPVAVLMARLGLSRADAEAKLAAHDQNLRAALGEKESSD